MKGRAVFLGYLISLGFALLIGGSFFIATTLTGDYNLLARYGGAAWIFLLSLIIALPTVIPRIKRK